MEIKANATRKAIAALEFLCMHARLFPCAILTGLWSIASSVWAGYVDPQIEDAGEMVVLSTPASPRVAYFAQLHDGILILTVQVGTFAADGSGASLDVGLAADKVIRLSPQNAATATFGHTITYTFRIPANRLVSNEADWSKLRMGFSVQWTDGTNGARQIESFSQNPQRATHAGLSTDPTNWEPVDLDELSRSALAAHTRITFSYTQPMDGKATIVVEDAKGNRIRNLISGQPMQAGPQQITWDGADDEGNAVPPGDYVWRAISHPGLSLHYMTSYENAPGSNEGTFESAATDGTNLFFGAHVTEGGFENIELKPDGTFIRGFNAPTGHGLNRNAIATDGKFLYTVYDGFSWGQGDDRSHPDWHLKVETRLWRFDAQTGDLVDFPHSRSVRLNTYEMGPGSPLKISEDAPALAGVALYAGKLWEADRVDNVLRQIDPATGDIGPTVPLKDPVALAANDNGLYVIAAGQLAKIDPATGQLITLAKLPGKPQGLFAAADGRFFVSDGAPDAQYVRILDNSGHQTGTLGTPGGSKAGTYDPLAMHNPAGLVLSPDGHLWVAESNRWRPKRLAAYDLVSNSMWKEFFGPTDYGAPGASFDPQNPAHWIGQDTLFNLDLATGTVKPLANMGGEEGMHYRFWRQDGRTFVIAYGTITYIEELRPDNTLKPLAFIGDAHNYCRIHSWWPPQEFLDAFHRDYPNLPFTPGVVGHPDHGYGMLWVDRNGDGIVQADEIEFSTAAKSLSGSWWGNDQADLTLRVPGWAGNHAIMVTLKPDGYWPGGAPRYPALNDAIAKAVPIELKEDQPYKETTVDHFGTMLVNSDPVMKAFTPDGRELWSFPNRWSNVHGSHDAPFPQRGELQGVLFFTGVAPLDDQGDVTVMNGNHGRLFAMTTDGLYLDEMFHDVRLVVDSQAMGVGVLGGECFGGSFARSEKDGNYYYQGGGIEYHVYRIDGLQQIKRSHGTITVTAEQAVAAEGNLLHKVAVAAPPHAATLPYRSTPPDLTTNSNDGWPDAPQLAWERVPGSRVEIRACYDNQMLYLQYNVADPSPWVNNGKDWQMLFKTGDSVDLQLGTDPQANPRRPVPVPGDLRLLIAPFKGENIAVLYRHRLPGATDSVVFQSPWRGEKVDSVEILKSVKITVSHDGAGYRVEAAIPWSDLGVNPASIAGQKLRADFGVIYGDAAGTVDLFRNYWANGATGLVNDVPGEIMLTPNLWGDLTLEPPKSP